MSDCNKDALEVKIQHLERDVDDLQKEQKEQGRLINDVIISLEKNSIKQTMMMEQLVERDEDMSKNIQRIGNDVDELKKGLVEDNKGNSDGENKIIHTLLGHLGKIILVLLLVLLTVYGIDASKYINL